MTPRQIKKLEYPKRKIKWSAEDISSAISLQSVSTKEYRHLRSQNYSLSTLRKWDAAFNVNLGILKDVVT